MTTDDVLGLAMVGSGDATPVVASAASVPLLFRWSHLPGGVVWVLTDDQSTWPADAAEALQRGAAAVVVDSPRTVTPEAFALLAESSRPVILATARTHAPQLRAFADRLAGVRDDVAWVEVLLVEQGAGPLDPAAALWDALVTLSSAGLPVDDVDQVTVRDGALLVEARSGGARVHVTCVRSLAAPARLRVEAFGAFGSLGATAGDPLVAAPGAVVQVGGDGSHQVPTDYRTPRKIALCEVHATVARGLGTMSPLSGYGREVALVGRMFGATARDVQPLE